MYMHTCIYICTHIYMNIVSPVDKWGEGNVSPCLLFRVWGHVFRSSFTWLNEKNRIRKVGIVVVSGLFIIVGYRTWRCTLYSKIEKINMPKYGQYGCRKDWFHFTYMAMLPTPKKTHKNCPKVWSLYRGDRIVITGRYVCTCRNSWRIMEPRNSGFR